MDATTTLVMIVIFLSALVRWLTGFGNALVAMPLLALILPMRVATPVVAATALVLGFAMLSQLRDDIDFRSVLWLVVFATIGVPIGLLLLRGANEGLVQILLAIVIAGFAVFTLAKPRLWRIRGGISTALAGLTAGVLGGAYNANGPPVVIYATLRGWDPEKFKGTLQGFFIPANIVIVVGHIAGGFWTTEVVRLSLYSMLPIGLAMLVGAWLAPRIPASRFVWLVNGMLLVCAGLLLWRGVAAF